LRGHPFRMGTGEATRRIDDALPRPIFSVTE
jgi:hypothetical protein